LKPLVLEVIVIRCGILSSALPLTLLVCNLQSEPKQDYLQVVVLSMLNTTTVK
jgi:hypothetical protein